MPKLKMSKQNKEIAVCALLFIAAIGFFVGGFFVPLLMVPAAAFFSGAVGLMGVIVHDDEKVTINQPNINNFNHYEAGSVNSGRVTRTKYRISPKLKSSLFSYDSGLVNVDLDFAASKDAKSLSGTQSKIDGDVLKELERLNEIISHLELSQMDKVASECHEKAYRHPHLDRS